MPPITTCSEAETMAVARELAGSLEPDATILLTGDLGAGKTAFVRGLAEGLGADPAEVSSPTFTLIQRYSGGRLPLVHVDLYRLNDPREVEELGLDELAAGGVLAIEWAEKLRRWPAGATVVHIDQDDETRTIAITRTGSSALPW
jgi:tRNA threonylcarbamoyl adenosine modification protein YjeE